MGVSGVDLNRHVWVYGNDTHGFFERLLLNGRENGAETMDCMGICIDKSWCSCMVRICQGVEGSSIPMWVAGECLGHGYVVHVDVVCGPLT